MTGAAPGPVSGAVSSPGSRRRAWLGAGLVACAAAVTAGCSGGISQQTGQANAARAKAQVLPVARDVLRAMESSGTGWAPAFSGLYTACGAGGSQVAYKTSQDVLSFDRKISQAAYLVQVSDTLRAAGWRLRAAAGTPGYAISKGGFTGSAGLVLNSPSPGQTASISVYSRCVDAGPAASGLTSGINAAQFPQPAPTVTPSPRYGGSS